MNELKVFVLLFTTTVQFLQYKENRRQEFFYGINYSFIHFYMYHEFSNIYE